MEELKRLDFDKYESDDVFNMVLSCEEPQVIIAKGNESAILFHWSEEYEELIEAHPRILPSDLSNIKEPGGLGMMAMQVQLTGEQDAVIFMDEEGEKKLVLAGIERFKKFKGYDFVHLSDEQMSQLVELWIKLPFQDSSEDIESNLQVLALGFAVILVKLLKWGGQVNGFEQWQKVVFASLETLEKELEPEEHGAANEAIHDFKNNWELYEDKDPLKVALKYQIAKIFNTDDDQRMNELTEELRPQVEEFISTIDEILKVN